MKASKVNDKFQEALYLAIELLRANALHNGRIGTRLYSGGPNFQGSEEDKRSMLLVMRVLSIVPLSFHVRPLPPFPSSHLSKPWPNFFPSSPDPGPAPSRASYSSSTRFSAPPPARCAPSSKLSRSTSSCAPTRVARARTSSTLPSPSRSRPIQTPGWGSCSSAGETRCATWREGWMSSRGRPVGEAGRRRRGSK